MPIPTSDRSKAEIIFVSSGFSKEAAITFLNNGASFHIWNTDTQVWPSHTVIFLVNVAAYFGRIRINAKGFTAFLIEGSGASASSFSQSAGNIGNVQGTSSTARGMFTYCAPA